MNVIDIIIIVCFAISLILGFRDGVIRQLGSLAGIIIAIFLAKQFGSLVSSTLGIGGDYADIWGYVIVLLVALVGAAAITSLLRKIISVVGLGALDRLAGSILAAIKCALLLSILCFLFTLMNTTFGLVDSKVVKSSKLFEPVSAVSQYIMPAIDWIGDQLPETEQQNG